MAHRALISPLERLEALDGVADWWSAKVNRLVGPAKSLLSGTWLGHPLHPGLTDVVVGAWGAGVALDLLAGDEAEAAADRLIGLGVLAFFPTAASGWSDWADSYGAERRVGLIHGLVNGGAMSLFAASWFARRGGHRGRGRLLALVGAAEMTLGAYLGGHLTYGRGLGVDHTAFDHPPEDWTDVGHTAPLPEGALTRGRAKGVAVLLYRRGEETLAIADTCTHAGGPLHKGEIDADDCVTCPWHGSRFRLRGGGVVRGPASSSAVSFETRTHEGRLQVRAAGAR